MQEDNNPLFPIPSMSDLLSEACHPDLDLLVCLPWIRSPPLTDQAANTKTKDGRNTARTDISQQPNQWHMPRVVIDNLILPEDVGEMELDEPMAQSVYPMMPVDSLRYNKDARPPILSRLSKYVYIYIHSFCF